MKEKGKLILISQILLFIVFILYLLESIFISGMFTNVFLLMGVTIFTIIALIIALIKKEFKLAIVDIAICTVCFCIFNMLVK